MGWEQVMSRNDVIGGDLEFFIPPCGVIRGPIYDILVKPTGFLRIYTEWLAEKILHQPIAWVGLEYLQSAGLHGSWKQWMGKSKTDARDERLVFDNGRTINLMVGTGWWGIIHPMGTTKLDPANVGGLILD